MDQHSTRKTPEEIKEQLREEIKKRLVAAGNSADIVEDALRVVDSVIGGER